MWWETKARLNQGHPSAAEIPCRLSVPAFRAGGGISFQITKRELDPREHVFGKGWRGEQCRRVTERRVEHATLPDPLDPAQPIIPVRPEPLVARFGSSAGVASK